MLMPSRRAVLAGGLATVGLSSLRPALAQEQTLYVNTFGGAWLEAERASFYNPFTEKTGITIKPVTAMQFAKLKAVAQSKNYEFDCANFNEIEFQQAVTEGYFEPIDTTVVDTKALDPKVVHSHGIASQALGTVIAYRKEKFPNGGPQSWADFWDVKRFPGSRALIDRSYSCLAYALLADGVPADKLYPLDVDRAFRKLDQIKPHVKVWWTQGNQSQQLLRDGEVDVLVIWNRYPVSAAAEGLPVETIWNGAEQVWGYWGVVKGTPRSKLAWRFAAFYQDPQLQADFAKRTYYGPSNPKAFEFLPNEVTTRLPTNPALYGQGFRHDAQWLSTNLPRLSQMWTKWMAG